MMIVLRVLTVFIFTAMLTGCALPGNISLLKGFLKEFPPPNQCGPPGYSQAIICNYRLVVTPMKDPDMFSGHVAPDLVDQGEAACEQLKPELRKYPGLEDFECAGAKNYKYVEYGFTILGDKPPNDGKPREFINVANTHSLKLGHLDGVKVDVTDAKTMDPGRK
jgi:hypothetical protein